MTTIEKPRTAGEYATEFDAWAAFDDVLKLVPGAFRVYEEVCGEYVQPRIGTEEKGARVDRLMIPIAGAVAAGWRDGAIAVEGKKSDHKIGKMIAQGLDYSRCAWRLEDRHKPGPEGLILMTEWVFLYPIEHVPSELMSIMAQNRIGQVSISKNGLWFTCGGMNTLVIRTDGTITAKSLPMGRKRGSR